MGTNLSSYKIKIGKNLIFLLIIFQLIVFHKGKKRLISFKIILNNCDLMQLSNELPKLKIIIHTFIQKDTNN